MRKPKKKNDWFEEWFSSKFYLQIYKHRDDSDAKLLIDLVQRTLPLKCGDKILDIACGAGRHSLELARRGYKVTGIDLSSYLINEGRKTLTDSKEQNLKLVFKKTDMRKFDFKNSFDVAVNLFTSFGYFVEDKENFRVFDNVRKSLKIKGFFVFDYLNSVYLRKNLLPRTVNRFGNFNITQTRKIIEGFVLKKIRIKDASKVREFFEKLRLFEPPEIERALTDRGFKIINKAGDYFGNEFKVSKSNRLIIFAQKI